jgi:hypothetical protein
VWHIGSHKHYRLTLYSVTLSSKSVSFAVILGENVSDHVSCIDECLVDFTCGVRK